MLRKFITLAIAITLSATAFAQTTTNGRHRVSTYDQGEPFGYSTRSSRTDASQTYNITGGGTFDVPTTKSMEGVKILTSNGKDMREEIMEAIENNRIVILDGSEGDFTISSLMTFNGLKDRTILGVKGARLCTTWYASKEVLDMLVKAGVPEMSTSNGGDTLVNGQFVREQAEYMTRKLIIDMTGDPTEAFRNSGIFIFNGCENIVIRNLKLQGPGSIDVGGADLMSIKNGSKHMWIDHCDFADGMDGNFDITTKADFITVSWCTFSYTERSFMHQNTNLVGFSDKETPGFLNITFAYNHWGKGCRARMPMARAGRIHMLNNYYTCTGNYTACMNPRMNSEFLIEGNYFDKSVTRFFSTKDAIAWTWKSTNFIGCGADTPKSNGNVTVPYTYKQMKAKQVPEQVGTYAGATLW